MNAQTAQAEITKILKALETTNKDVPYTPQAQTERQDNLKYALKIRRFLMEA